MSLKSCVSCFSFRAQRVSQEQTAYLLGRGASFSNRISIQLLLLEELKTLTQEMSSWTHLCDGTTETWWNCRARQRPHRKPVERWCPRDGDSHPLYITPVLDHVSSCLQENIHKGNVLSYSPLFLVYWTNNGFTPASPCSSKGITGSSYMVPDDLHTTWYWIYMTPTIGKTSPWCSVVFPLRVTEHGGGLTLWFQMTTEGNCCLRKN